MVIGLNLINENMNKKCFDMVVDEFKAGLSYNGW